MQKKNEGIAQGFALKGLLFLVAFTMSAGFFACKVAVGGGGGGGKSYTITYELDGGANAPENPASYNVETETIPLKDPVKKGYTFVGWFKDAEFTTQVTEIAQGSTGNIILYAKWVPYTTVKVEGGTAVLNETSVTLSSFWISPYEVTQEEFESVMTGNKNDIAPSPVVFLVIQRRKGDLWNR